MRAHGLTAFVLAVVLTGCASAPDMSEVASDQAASADADAASSTIETPTQPEPPAEPVLAWQDIQWMGFTLQVALVEVGRSIHSPIGAPDAPPGYEYITFRAATRHQHQDRQATLPQPHFEVVMRADENSSYCYEAPIDHYCRVYSAYHYDGYTWGSNFPAGQVIYGIGSSDQLVDTFDLAAVRIYFTDPTSGLSIWLPAPRPTT